MAILTSRMALNAHAQDAGYMHMVRQALANGLPFLETLLHADWMDASRGVGSSARQKRLIDPLIEVIFEDVRVAEFASLPSREGSVHLFRSATAAQRFNTEFRAGSGRVYRCHVDLGTPFESYMDWVNPGVDLLKELSPQLEAMRDRARAYWRREPPSTSMYPEALVHGRVLVDTEET
jgi:hypothetical protein